MRSPRPLRAARCLRATVVEDALSAIRNRDQTLNAFTDVTAERALARADALDADRAAGKPTGPLAGVPFAVKNLFDVQGLPTRAGSKINRELPPAEHDSPLIEKLEAAGAILVGALNMGEYAYDFTGENVHDGPSRNPHDVEPDVRWVVRRLGLGGWRRSRAAVARLRHQRLDPRAVVVLRHFRAEADLWPAVARAQLSVRGEPRSSRSVRALHPRSRDQLRRDAGLRSRRCRLRGPPGRSRRCRNSIAASTACVSRSPAAISARAPSRKRCRRSSRSRRRSMSRARSNCRKRSGRARRPMSSPRPRARRCISTGCGSAPMISTRQRATA